MDWLTRRVSWWCGTCGRIVAYNEAHSHVNVEVRVGNSSGQAIGASTLGA